MLRNVQLPYIQKKGYVNLRCVWTLGCPVEIHPMSDQHRDDVHAGEYFFRGFQELFPELPVPEEVGVSCCAQFGASRDKIRERPKSDYEHFRNWLVHTKLTDDLSGRIMEYSWHSKEFPCSRLPCQCFALTVPFPPQLFLDKNLSFVPRQKNAIVMFLACATWNVPMNLDVLTAMFYRRSRHCPRAGHMLGGRGRPKIPIMACRHDAAEREQKSWKNGSKRPYLGYVGSFIYQRCRFGSYRRDLEDWFLHNAP